MERKERGIADRILLPVRAAGPVKGGRKFGGFWDAALRGEKGTVAGGKEKGAPGLYTTRGSMHDGDKARPRARRSTCRGREGKQGKKVPSRSVYLNERGGWGALGS